MKRKFFRMKHLIDTGMQMSVALSLGATLLMLTLSYAIAVFFSSSDDMLSSGEASRDFGLVIAGAYFVLVLIATVMSSIVATHRIAGPAMLLERAIRGMRKKDYGQRVKLRSKDHLKSLAAEFEGLRDEVRTAEADHQNLLASIGAALADERYSDAADLCRSSVHDGVEGETAGVTEQAVLASADA